MGDAEKERSNKNENSWAGVAKWVVVGVIGLTFMFLFRTELGQLLERVTGINIKGVVEIKTAETPLGKTVFSNVPMKSTSALVDGIQGTSYVSQRNNFQISWPDNVNWSASESLGETLHQRLGLAPTVEIPLVIMKNEITGGFRPNINVVVESIGNMSIGQYMDLGVKQTRGMGWQILSNNVDESTQGGLLVFRNKSSGNEVYQFQRYAIASGRAFVITASQLPPDNVLSQQLREELRSILNSFRVIS